VDPYSEANRGLWEEWARIHATSPEAARFYDLDAFKAGASKLRDDEVAEVGPVEGKDLLHLQCHIGIDTLSWARLGARVTGVDFSPEAIRRARGLAEDLGIPATFVESDILSLPDAPELRGTTFDVVYTSRGVVGWLPDLARWGEVVAHFLRPGGVFYITEGHPFMWVFEDEAEDLRPGDLRVRYHYFPRAEPLRFDVQGSYADPAAAMETPHEYSWQHSMGEIVTAIASAGLRIEFLHEFPFLEWPVPFLVERDGRWRLPEDAAGEIPLMYSLRATKPG
jgi:SAM-dependent methyltransferase